MRRSVTKYVLSFSMMLALLAVFAFTPQARAATHVNSAPPSLSPIKGCAVTDVRLHGNNPASVTCRQWRSASQLVSPNTGIVICNEGSFNALVEGSEGTFCFSGTGYLGIHITHITEVVVNNASWLRLYPSGSTSGFFYNQNPGVVSMEFPIDRQHDMTQFCDACGFH